MPENANYMVAAYVVAGVVYIVYAGLLLRRAVRALRRR